MMTFAAANRALHKAFDEATAILVGDALQSMAFQIISADPVTQKNALGANNRLAMVQLLSKRLAPREWLVAKAWISRQ